MSHDIEFEAKLLTIDVEKMSAAIVAIGGTQIGDFKFRRYVFDTIPARKGLWLRLRTNGITSTLTVKEIADDTIDGTSEWEVTISDFDTTFSILQKSGFKPKGYQENRRIEFSLNGAMLSIDYWPMLKPYLEIEAEDKASVIEIANKLGYKEKELVADNTMKLYSMIGIDLDTVADLRF